MNAAPPREAGRWRVNETSELQTLLRGTVERGSGRRARMPCAPMAGLGRARTRRRLVYRLRRQFVAGVGVGMTISRNGPRHGGSLPAEIWAAFMRDAIKQDPALSRRETHCGVHRRAARTRRKDRQECLSVERPQSQAA